MANSGADVPKATIVREIIIFATFRFNAVDDIPSMNRSAPLIRIINPIIIKIMFAIIVYGPFVYVNVYLLLMITKEMIIFNM